MPVLPCLPRFKVPRVSVGRTRRDGESHDSRKEEKWSFASILGRSLARNRRLYKTANPMKTYPQLPPELWLDIFEFADMGTMAQLMCVDRATQRLAEVILYRYVHLRHTNDRIALFASSLCSCPRRAPLVHSLSISAHNAHDYSLASHVLNILRRCTNLRDLKINVVPPCEICARADWAVYAGFVKAHYPHLRRLSINLYDAPVHLIDFFARHPDIEDLDMCGVPQPHTAETSLELLSKAHLPSLRYLASPSWVLLSGLTIPSNLTHVSLSSYRIVEVSRMLSLLGSALVSLKLGMQQWDDEPWEPGQSPTTRFGEVYTRFPCLRFLQVTMVQEDHPDPDGRPIGWHCEAKQSYPASSMSHLTIVWCYEAMYTLPRLIGHAAAVWTSILNERALQILQGWRCVARIVYCLPDTALVRTWTYLSLGEDGGLEEIVKLWAGTPYDCDWRNV